MSEAALIDWSMGVWGRGQSFDVAFISAIVYFKK